MKKILLSMLMAGIMIPAMAQQKMTPAQGVSQTVKAVNADFFDRVGTTDEVPAMPYLSKGSRVYNNVELQQIPASTTKYDMQAQGDLNNQISVHKDGFIGMVWTYSGNGANENLRTVAYSYSNDRGNTWSDTEKNFSGNIVTYWPSYCAWGANGELILARTNANLSGNRGYVIMRRPNKGTDEWEMFDIENPEDAPAEEGYVLAWARVCSSGDNNQYIHVITGMALPGYFDNGGIITSDPYHGTNAPILYNRSSDGGKTWDFEWRVIQEEVPGFENDPDRKYSESYTFVVKNEHIAFPMFSISDDGVILHSPDHGNTWEKTTFYKCSFDMSQSINDPVLYHRPIGRSSVAFDGQSKMHVAFPVHRFGNAENSSETENTFSVGASPVDGAIAYWNEYRPMLDTASFKEIYQDWMYNFWPWEWDEEADTVTGYYPYFISNKYTPYIIGQAVTVTSEPQPDTHPGYTGFTFPERDPLHWTFGSYRNGGVWTYAQIIIDETPTARGTGRIHVCYLGLLDAKSDSQGHPLRHVFYTYSDDGGETWVQPVHVTDDILMDESEFAYLGVGGIYGNDIYYFAQVDNMGGSFAAGDQASIQTDNDIYCIILRGAVGIKEKDAKPTIEVHLIPNPASGSSKVSFEGKATVEVRNIIGQLVYKVENVTEEHHIPLTGLASGAYLVTVRNGKTATTQKLIVQ